MPGRVSANRHLSTYLFLLLTKPMTWPVLPPMPDRVLPTVLAAPETAEPAELVTRERPCCALPTVSWVASLALVAPEDAAFAASEVVEAARRWTAHRDWRRANLGAIRADIVCVRVV